MIFPLACSDFPIQHLVSFLFFAHLEDSLATSLLGDMEIIYLRNTRPKLWAFGVGQNPTTNLKFGFFWQRAKKSPQTTCAPKLVFSVAAQACISPANRDDQCEMSLSEQLPRSLERSCTSGCGWSCLEVDMEQRILSHTTYSLLRESRVKWSTQVLRHTFIWEGPSIYN